MRYIYMFGCMGCLLALLVSVIGFGCGMNPYLAGAFGGAAIYGGFVMSKFVENAE
jgi:hypothetical protein